MHIYEREFLRLLNEQPKNLNTIQKLLRLDKLACIEMYVNMKLEVKVEPTWFFTIMVIVEHLLFKLVPKSKEYDELDILTLQDAKVLCSNNSYSNNISSEDLDYYLDVRRTFREFIKEECPSQDLS